MVFVRDGEPNVVVHGVLDRAELLSLMQTHHLPDVPLVHASAAPSMGCALAAVFSGEVTKGRARCGAAMVVGRRGHAPTDAARAALRLAKHHLAQLTDAKAPSNNVAFLVRASSRCQLRWSRQLEPKQLERHLPCALEPSGARGEGQLQAPAE